ncbi:MAG: hypothetical protein NWE98_10750 [Candidatus Bathyarchaeota archaeon]|nr:hypothetical protein [Candidatus Bathyarchaeota archaeon]
MFRPERMTSASIICLRKDVDTILEALNNFGQFHIEHAAENASLNEHLQGIQKTEETLANINELIKILNLEKTGMLEIFKDTKIVKTQVTAENWQDLAQSITEETHGLKNEAENLTISLTSLQEKTTQLLHIQDMLIIMDKMGADLQAIEESRLIHVAIASVPTKNIADLDRALTGFPLIFHRCYLAKDMEFVCMAVQSKHAAEAERILKTYHGEIFHIPQELPHDIKEALNEVSRQLKENAQKKVDIKAALEKLGSEKKSRLFSLREIAQNILALLEAKTKILQSEQLATIKGFVPTKDFHRLTEKVHVASQGTSLVLENEPLPMADPPTLIRHNRFVKPFEELTHLYGLPYYDELDPTPMIAVTFPILFGLMFGDVGHGAVLLAIGLTLGFFIKKESAMKNLCWILAACGVGAIIAGLLFGEVFGRELFTPLWLNPFNNVLTFLIFCLIVGVIQIMSGFTMELGDFALRRNWGDIFLTSIPKIAFYAGSVYLIAAYQLNFAAWLSGPILFVLVPFLILVFAKPVLYNAKIFSGAAGSKETVSFSERLFESGDLVTRLLSNTVSYTRILALLMAHWALVTVTYTIAGLVSGSSSLGMVLGSIVIVGGNIFVIALEGLIVFIHSLRLHFYEWFSKFYQGTGTPFAPFKQTSEYAEVMLTQKTAKN